jgi:Flp pilus assembly protein TadG
MALLRLARRTKPRRERGAALIMIALCLTAMMATAGVIVDGGNAFAQRRQMQNAADSAALAGARALDRYNVSPLSNLTTSILSAVTTSAAANGATITGCRLLDQLQVDLGICPTLTNVTIPGTSTAVKVTVQSTTNTSFMRVVGVNNFTVRASAVAQIERLSSANSPFVMCGVGKLDPRSLGDGQPIGKEVLTLGTNTINPLAIGQTYSLHFTGNGPDAVRCGQNTNFKGVSLDQSSAFPLPGTWDVDTGNHGVNVQPTVIAGDDACKVAVGWTTGCLVAVPICYAVPNPLPPAVTLSYGTSGKLYCVRFAAFRVQSIGSSTLTATLVNGVLGTGGQGGGAADSGEIRVIKLSQ